jgi:arsenate reductase
MHSRDDKPASKSDDTFEPREYSSPACFAHEFEISPQAGTLTIYHNPACSKSRETLELIRASGVTPRIVEYLKTPPTQAELAAIARKLGVAPEELVRKTEPVFREKYQGRALGDSDWLEALGADPILLQRPIVVRGDSAVIGRPPQNVQPLLRR